MFCLAVILLAINICLVDSLKIILQLSADTKIASFKLKYSKHLTADKDEISSYQYVEIGGFVAVIGEFDSNLIKSLFFDDSVEAISIDRKVQAATIQEFAPKHLVRIFQENKIKRNQRMNVMISNNTSHAYILDTGILASHSDFGDRVTKIGQGSDCDTNGHGTAVASVVGSELFGVAKNISLIDYSVLDENGIGNISSVICALDTIIKLRRTGVILLAFTGEKSVVFENALQEVSKLGYLIVAPAGNFAADACKYSPSGAVGVITVGSINSCTDMLAPFSNWGPCVDIFSDGIDVMTLGVSGEEIDIRSGTSLSAAMVAGLLATYMGENNTADEAVSRMRRMAIRGKIQPKEMLAQTSSPNLILSNILAHY
ncbi:DEKNAAC105068 [Brettanomyces naardenensis]|uniref:DEKNAAC105068 n=1 Tax=Brettanomyces naardenensis TaxID=13370 RepID=A0A448YS01_BRENA|nr:DEKNAAC105068 [Brettanomyces naardenensis]